MTRNNFVTALGFGVVTSILLTLDATAAECPRGSCSTGLNLKGVGGCVACGTPYSCELGGRGYWNYDANRCQADKWRPVKNIGKKKPVMPGTSGGAGGGSTDCGPGYNYDPESGCRKIKSIGKKKVMPGAEQAPEQAQPD